MLKKILVICCCTLLVITEIPVAALTNKLSTENNEENWVFYNDMESLDYSNFDMGQQKLNQTEQLSKPKRKRNKQNHNNNNTQEVKSEPMQEYQYNNYKTTPVYNVNFPVDNDRNTYETQIYHNNMRRYQSDRIRIPAGTAVTVYLEKEIDADDVREGQNVDFVVLDPVTINGTIVIKSGTHVTAQVTKKKNNCILGIPGEIQIGNFKLINSNNDVINLRGTIVDKGTNRAWANIGWIIVWPLLFIKGNDGKVPAGSYHILYTIGDTFFNVGQSYNRY